MQEEKKKKSTQESPRKKLWKNLYNQKATSCSYSKYHKHLKTKNNKIRSSNRNKFNHTTGQPIIKQANVKFASNQINFSQATDQPKIGRNPYPWNTWRRHRTKISPIIDFTSTFFKIRSYSFDPITTIQNAAESNWNVEYSFSKIICFLCENTVIYWA